MLAGAGVRRDWRDAAASANDALVARAPRCDECGRMLEFGHYGGCPLSSAPAVRKAPGHDEACESYPCRCHERRAAARRPA